MKNLQHQINHIRNGTLDISKLFFLSNIPTQSIDDIYCKLQPNKSCINEVVNDIASLFTNAAKLSFPYFPVHAKKANQPNHKPCFGPQCHQARKKYHMARNRYRRFKTDRNRLKLQQSSKAYKKQMNFYINYINKHKWKNAYTYCQFMSVFMKKKKKKKKKCCHQIKPFLSGMLMVSTFPASLSSVKGRRLATVSPATGSTTW